MCGICGIVRFDGKSVDADALARACEALRHRGPDHTAAYVVDRTAETVGFGATRLSILDPTPAGHQPMCDPSRRYHLVYNGEIYNFRALRRELAEGGWDFATGTDTEVVLAACARWGPACLPCFNGMWALAFLDAESRAGFLARDRFGIKPLFYSADDRSLCFASEIRANLNLTGSDQETDPEALVQHLAFGYIAQPSTIYRGVFRLDPGHYLQFTADGRHDPVRYSPPAEPEHWLERQTDYGTACVELRRRLADAVVARRVADVPIGAFLSGGLDSSIVVTHLAEASGRPVRTFSVGYADQRSYDETRFARLAADRFGTEHHDVVLTEREILDSIPTVLDHLGEPVGDSSIVPTSLVSKFAAAHVKVALSGDGGDELFGGYWRYLAHNALDAYQRIPQSLRRFVIAPFLGTLATSRGSGLGNRVRQFRKLLRAEGADPFTRHVAWARILAPEAEPLFRDHEHLRSLAQRIPELVAALSADVDKHDPLNRILAFDLQYTLPADMLQKVDLASMMHSLEVRVPFLDHTVVEYALGMPSCWKIDRGRRKRILVDAYRGWIPDEILDRPKQGFEVPIGEYFRGPLRDLFFDVVTRETIERFGILDYAAIEAIYGEHASRRADHADLLWALTSLCWWSSRSAIPGVPQPHD